MEDEIFSCPCCYTDTTDCVTSTCDYCLDTVCADCINVDRADLWICDNCKELNSHRQY